MNNNNSFNAFSNINNKFSMPTQHYDYPSQHQLVNITSPTMHVPSSFSLPNSQINSKILQIDNRIVNFSQYILFLWILMIFSLFALFSSIFILNNIDTDYTIEQINLKYNQRTFEIINFFINLIHIGGYGLAIKAFTSQLSDLNMKSEWALCFLAGTNLVYFFLYIFMYQVTFFIWCLDMFYLFLNGILYFQSKELTLLFQEKDKLKRFEVLLV